MKKIAESLVQNKKECYVCKTNLNLHKHHIYEGRNRNNSENYGCWVWLCARHHNMSNEGVHFNKDLDLELKRLCEKKWLEYCDKCENDFIKIFRRNYL